MQDCKSKANYGEPEEQDVFSPGQSPKRLPLPKWGGEKVSIHLYDGWNIYGKIGLVRHQSTHFSCALTDCLWEIGGPHVQSAWEDLARHPPSTHKLKLSCSYCYQSLLECMSPSTKGKQCTLSQFGVSQRMHLTVQAPTWMNCMRSPAVQGGHLNDLAVIQKDISFLLTLISPLLLCGTQGSLRYK